MACLANTVQANPDSFYFALSGAGPGSSLQSPATLIPGTGGTAILNVITANNPYPVTASINVGSDYNDHSGVVNIQNGNATGTSYLQMGNDALGVQFTVDGTSGTLNLENKVSGTPYLTVDTVNNNVAIGALSGGAIPSGSVTINEALFVKDGAGGANSLAITPSSATQSVIAQSVISGGTLSLGSSLAAPGTIAISDAGAGTAQVAVGGNGGTQNVKLQGGSVALDVPIINSTAADAGTLCLGSSATNPQTMFITNTGGANNGYVDITGGTSTGTAVRLRGYGVGTSATVSTNNVAGILNVSSGPADSSPAIVISPTALTLNRNQTVFAAPTVGSGAYGITQQIIASGGNIGTTAYPLTNPTLAGVYNILVRVGTAAAININGQISTTGYWDGTVWVAGGVNISPPLGTGNLYIWFGNSATTRTTLLLQNTGSAELSGVAVYMIPQLFGLSAVIT